MAVFAFFRDKKTGSSHSLIEAMHYGVPCACSKTSSLGEIGQNAANLFDPADVEDISKALHDILTSEQSQARLIEAGRKRARDFSWTRHAATMTDIYHQRNNRK